MYTCIVDKYSTLNAMVFLVTRHLDSKVVDIGYILQTNIPGINLVLQRSILLVGVMLNGDLLLIEYVAIVLDTNLVKVKLLGDVHALVDFLKHAHV